MNTEPMRVEVDADELLKLRYELHERGKQIVELQERNNELVKLWRRISIRANVAHFHRVTGNPVLDRPQVPPPERCRLRMALESEEFFEVAEAMYAGNPDALRELEAIRAAFAQLVDGYTPEPDIVAVAKELCDRDYISEGTRLEFGIDGGPVLAEVQKSNLSKAGGPKRADGKQLRPEGWQPPDIASVLREQGWRG